MVDTAASLDFDDDFVRTSSLHFEAEVAAFSFLRADVLDPLPVTGVCSSNWAFQKHKYSSASEFFIISKNLELKYSEFFIISKNLELKY